MGPIFARGTGKKVKFHFFSTRGNNFFLRFFFGKISLKRDTGLLSFCETETRFRILITRWFLCFGIFSFFYKSI